jgi:hypothetical protein
MNERFLATAAVALGLGAAFGSGTGGAGDVEVAAPARSAVEALPTRESPEPPAAGVETKQASGSATEWLSNGVAPRTDFFAVAAAAVSAPSRAGDGNRPAAGSTGQRIRKGASRVEQATQADPLPPTPDP